MNQLTVETTASTISSLPCGQHPSHSKYTIYRTHLLNWTGLNLQGGEVHGKGQAHGEDGEEGGGQGDGGKGDQAVEAGGEHDEEKREELRHGGQRLAEVGVGVIRQGSCGGAGGGMSRGMSGGVEGYGQRGPCTAKPAGPVVACGDDRGGRGRERGGGRRERGSGDVGRKGRRPRGEGGEGGEGGLCRRRMRIHIHIHHGLVSAITVRRGARDQFAGRRRLRLQTDGATSRAGSTGSTGRVRGLAPEVGGVETHKRHSFRFKLSGSVVRCPSGIDSLSVSVSVSVSVYHPRFSRCFSDGEKSKDTVDRFGFRAGITSSAPRDRRCQEVDQELQKDDKTRWDGWMDTAERESGVTAYSVTG